MQFLSFEDVKSLGELEKDEVDYPVISILESSVISAIESYTKTILKKSTYTKKLNYYTQLLEVDALPVISVTSIITESGYEYVASDYRIRDWGIELLSPVVLDESVTIVYTGGYSKLPGDLYRAILLQTVYEYQNHDHIGASSVTNEGGSVQTPSLQLLPEVVRLIKGYKNILKATI